MEFIKILFNIAFTVVPLLLQLLLQIPAARTTSENEFQYDETIAISTATTTAATTTTTAAAIVIQSTTTTTSPQPTPPPSASVPATTTNSQATTTTTATATTYSKNKNNKTPREQRKHEQIIDNSIDFTVDPCDDFYQYACGEWKHQLYDEDGDHNADANADADSDADNDDPEDKNQHEKGNDQTAEDLDKSGKYDRTLEMIDYLADKEVLKYFNIRNMTKYYNTAQTLSPPTTVTATTRANATTKEPDFIIKVYKYYKSCIAIQRYEPIKYLEWLELNEHVKWPSLINTTTATATSAATENSEQHDHDHDHQHDADFTAEVQEDEIIMDDDDDDGDDDDGDGDGDGDGDDNDDEAEIEVETVTEKLEDNYNSTWINTLATLRKYGMNGIFIEEVIYSTKTFPSKLLMGFDKPIKEDGFKSLKSEHLRSILNNLDLDFTPDSFKQLWLQVTKFEWQLTKLNDISDQLGTTMIRLEHLPVPWLNQYLRVIFNQTSLDLNMRIVLTNAAYFIALDDLLSEQDDRFLNQYLQIRFLWHLYQQEPQTFQPLDCILHIKRFTPLAFEWIYEKQHDHLVQEIPKIHVIYNNLRKQFNHTLYNNKNNFNSSTLEHFVSKLESVQFKVGTFVDIDRADFFYENRKFYKQLKLSSHEFYHNHLKMLKFNFDALHFGMRSVTAHSLFYNMQEYNRGLASAPYFNKRLNILHIPLSLLQPPLYHSEFSEISKYSSLGFILAQTLMYGFNLNDLAAEEHAKLMHHSQCLGSLDPLEINDKIADVSGVRLAYHTFFHTTLNNLISNRKIFFLNFAQAFCGSHKADDMLGRRHINYALAQFSEFSKTFECSPDSHMNPHEKCYLWD